MSEKKTQKTSKNLKKTLLISALSLVLVGAIVGVTVWAAAQQTVSLTNTVSITADSGVFVHAVVAEKIDTRTNTILSTDLSGGDLAAIIGGTYTARATLEVEEDEVESTLTNPEFRYKDLTAGDEPTGAGYAYVAYRFVFTNDGNNVATYTVTPTKQVKENSTQLTYYYVTQSGAKTDATILTGDVTKGTPVTFYLVLAIDKSVVSEMYNLKDMAEATQNIQVSIVAKG
ncbi:MAG: hypothetical protein LBM01_01750 [Christensenellaceae bacterium]|jgi:hypothetical protein|nr:hypothetical protein [Christensenellaceae bacterium]